MIKTLDSKQNVDTAPEIQALKNQLSEKERYIEQMEVGKKMVNGFYMKSVIL